MPAGQFPLDEMIDGVRRELAYREHVYPRLIAAGRMKQWNADYQINLMKAVAENLDAQRPAQPEQGALL